MRRIIRSAGIFQYPRALHNLRLSCTSEWVLVDRRDLVTVAEWAGHTIQIMTRHYLKQIHADSASQAALQAAGIGGAEVGLQRVASGVRHGNLTGKITPYNPVSTTNPQALPAGLSEWAILDSNQ
jgi:hypothetical protein